MNIKSEQDLFIKRLNILFKKNNLTSYRVSKNSRMHPSTLNNILSGKFKDIRYSTIVKICNGLDISIKEFFSDDLFN